jgi:hypothetical protein
MIRTCKHKTENAKSHKCVDNYYSDSKKNVMCRVVEWKRKKGVCPYDKTIHSVSPKIHKAILSKEQRQLI